MLFVALYFPNWALSQKEKQPNIILIVIDDLNDYTGFLGGHPQVKTPHMDALAKEGVVFSNAHTNAPICAPSRASMFTGIYPHVSQNFWFTEWTKNEALKNSKSIAQYMGDNGYSTYATGKLMHHRVKSEWDEYGIANTFGPYAFNGRKVVPHPITPKAYLSNKNDELFTSLANVPDVPADDEFPGYSGWYDASNRKPFEYVDEDNRDLLNDEQHAKWAVEKIRALEETETDTPFFIAVGFVRPHVPFVAPKSYFDPYPFKDAVLPKKVKGDWDDIPKRGINYVTSVNGKMSSTYCLRLAATGFSSSYKAVRILPWLLSRFSSIKSSSCKLFTIFKILSTFSCKCFTIEEFSDERYP